MFEFQVYVTFAWTSEGLEPEQLRAWSREYAVLARQGVTRAAADLARLYSPHRAQELEMALNGRLAETNWRFERHGVVVHCRPEARVRLDDRVRRHLEPIWERMIKLEAEHEVNRRRTELVDELNRRWLAILEKLRGRPVAPSAARLTEEEFADAVRQLAKDQQETINRLSALLDTIKNDGRANGGLGDYERTQVFDLLTEALRDQMGPASTNGHNNTGGKTS